LIDSLSSSTDPNVRAYVDQLLTSPNHQNIIQEAYGIKQEPGVIEALARTGTLMAMFGNLKSFSSAVVSTPIKVATTLMADMI
jgi:hypothetical protein